MSKVTHSVFEPRFQTRSIHSKNGGSDSFQYQDICSETETQGTVGGSLLIVPSKSVGIINFQLPPASLCLRIFLEATQRRLLYLYLWKVSRARKSSAQDKHLTPLHPTLCSQKQLEQMYKYPSSLASWVQQLWGDVLYLFPEVPVAQHSISLSRTHYWLPSQGARFNK